MPEGIIVLTDKIQSPPACIGLAFITIMICAAFICFAGLLLQEYREEHHIGQLLTSIILFILAVACIFAAVLLFQQEEHIYKVMLSDNFPANELYKQFEVRDVDGLIYTILLKN